MIAITAKEKTSKKTPKSAKKTAQAAAVQPKKTAKAKKGPQKASGPGVIGSIIEFLSAASAKKPVSKAALADLLKERFPARERDSMLRTIQCQLPARLSHEKKLNVQSGEGGYWIE